MCMLEIKMSTDEAEDAPLVCLEEALKCKLSDDSKKILSQKRLEFLEDFGSNLARYNVFSRLAQSPMICRCSYKSTFRCAVSASGDLSLKLQIILYLLDKCKVTFTITVCLGTGDLRYMFISHRNKTVCHSDSIPY